MLPHLGAVHRDIGAAYEAKAVRGVVRADGVLSLALRRSGDFVGAEVAAREAIAVAPETESGHRMMALALHEQGLTAEAIAAAERSHKLDPTHRWALLALVIVTTPSQTDRARELADKLVHLAPEWAQAHHAAATVAKRLGRNRRAEAGFRRAINVGPHWSAHHNLGAVLRRMGKRAPALEVSRRSVETNPTDFVASDFIRSKPG